tara:strand:+ start:301 stop:1107 length:807 start_codon:yes stop_codon:yes gene_type:complete
MEETYLKYLSGYRYNDLLYFPIPKNASRFFRHIFKDKLGWEYIECFEDKLDDFTAFAHIRNPHERHLIGKSQLVLQEYRDVEDDEMKAFLHRDDIKWIVNNYSMQIDIHSRSLEERIHNYYEIDWIPLDKKEVSSCVLTEQFLSHHGINLPFNLTDEMNMFFDNNPQSTRKTNQRQMLIYDIIKSMISTDIDMSRDELIENFDKHIRIEPDILSKSVEDMFLKEYYHQKHYFNLEIQLYQEIIKNTDYWKSSWPEISWLHKHKAGQIK